MPYTDPKQFTNATAFAEGRLTEKARLTLEQNMNTLRYLEGAGMTKRTKLKIRDDTVYLMVGLGGQGTQKLKAVKRQIERDCVEDDIKRCVRFLAVDTDIGALRSINDFGPTEKVEIPTGTAARLADPHSATALPWVHPKLNDHITGPMNGLGWSGDGANQCRQVGRVKLADSNNRSNLIQKAQAAIASLNPDRDTKVRVIIIAGLAGGTGSGTIIDVPYIMRERVNGGGGVQIQRENFIIEGYVLLPSAYVKASDPKKAATGNRNAYAALKEIEYLMTLNSQCENNKQAEYRFCDITSKDNVFETCMVVDGMYAGGGTVDEPERLADEVVAHTIVTSIADLTAKDGQDIELDKNSNTFFGSTSYIANLAQECANQLAHTNYQQCPREANYRFISCGYYEVIVPVDLMTVYVANIVFRRIWKDYNEAFTVHENEGKVFVEEQSLTVKDIKRRLKGGEDLPFTELPPKTVEYMNRQFRDRGPYYMVNLLRAVVDYLSDAYIDEGASRYDEARDYLRSYRKVLQKLQNEDYSVYTLLIEQLQRILENDAQILTNTTRFKATFGETFYWVPIDLTKGDEGQKAVKAYLDNLMDETQIKDMADQFRDDLVNNRDAWVDMFRNNTFDAASQIRFFIENKIGKMVRATVEDYLVKLFTGNPNASVMGGDIDNSAPAEIDNALDTAAAQIFQKFDARSAPLANMENTNLEVFGKGLRNFILPISAPRIAQKLKDNHGIESKDLYYGTASDRLICMTMYVGVPAFFYRWVEAGEKAYEQDSSAVGLHMEQGNDAAANWTNFPNLIPVSKKTPTQRESELLKSARELLDEGLKYKLVYPSQNSSESYEYYILALKQPDGITNQMSLKDISELRVEQAKERIQSYIDEAKHPFTVGAVVGNPIPNMPTAHELVNDLKTQKILVEQRLSIGTQTLSPGDGVNLQGQALADYKYDLAVKLLRKSLFSQQSLRESVELMRFFENYVGRRNEQFAYEWKLNDRLDFFRQLLLSGVVTCEDETWNYTLDNAPRTLVMYANAQRVARKFNLYLAYLYFVDLKDEIYEQLKQYYVHVVPTERKRGKYLDQNMKNYYKQVSIIAHEHDYHEDYAMEKEDFEQKLLEAEWRDSNGKIVTAAQLRDFYRKMESELRPIDSTEEQVPLVLTQKHDCRICPSCGTSGIGADVKFCPNCGANLQCWTCPDCSKSGIGADVKFCPNCGHKRP